MVLLKEKIKEDLNLSLREKKEPDLSTLRLLSAEILNKEKEKRYKLVKEKPDLNSEELEKESQLNDEEIIEVVSYEIKKRREAILEFEKGKRNDLAEKEKKEIEVFQGYLPEQLSQEEIKKLAGEAVKKLGAKEIKDMGKVMAELMPEVKGKADGGLVSKIVKELIAS